ncbi:MAG: hypothetical protein ABI688_02630 [Bacteroidota bacterium]
MKDFIEQPTTAAGTAAKLPGKKDSRANLYVAYLNPEKINTCPADQDSPGYTRTYRGSIFSSTGGSYYVDGIPVILSQDEEAMLYEAELSEYY